MSTLALLRELRDVRDVLHDALEDGHQATDAVARLVSAKCLLSAQLTDVEEPPRRTSVKVVSKGWDPIQGKQWIRQQLSTLEKKDWYRRIYNPENIRFSFNGIEVTGYDNGTFSYEQRSRLTHDTGRDGLPLSPSGRASDKRIPIQPFPSVNRVVQSWPETALVRKLQES